MARCCTRRPVAKDSSGEMSAEGQFRTPSEDQKKPLTSNAPDCSRRIPTMVKLCSSGTPSTGSSVQVTVSPTSASSRNFSSALRSMAISPLCSGMRPSARARQRMSCPASSR